MIKIGDYNKFKIARKADFGYYLDAEGKRTSDDILLPNGSTVDEGLEIGDEVEVFVYRDSWDRIIATQKKPFAVVGDLAVLEVKTVNDIGAFVDFGLERDILVPHKEQLYKMEEGKSYLVYIYIDKTGRLAATTDVDRYLDYMEEPELWTEVTGRVYGYQTNGSLSVAVDKLYKAAVLTKEYFTDIKPGDVIKGKINRIYEDGMVSLTLREKKLDEKSKLEESILDYLKKNNGEMSFNDKSASEDIRKQFNCSKNYFKMALGGLMKKGLIEQSKEGTRLK